MKVSFRFLSINLNLLLQVKLDNKKSIQILTLPLAGNSRYKKNKHIL